MVDVVQFFSTFQLSYQNKSTSEFQQDVRKIERHGDRQTDRQNLVIKTKFILDRKTSA